MDNIVFTPAGLLDLLVNIDELSEYDIGLTETIDHNIQLQIGESIYQLSKSDAEDVVVDDSVVDEVSDINDRAYQELESSGGDVEIQELDDVESGIIKELVKTLLVGGMVRLAGKTLKK